MKVNITAGLPQPMIVTLEFESLANLKKLLAELYALTDTDEHGRQAVVDLWSELDDAVTNYEQRTGKK
jgi:hypothetical protein